MAKASRNPAADTGVVKLKDVALLAGCSVATASRVLNGHPTVGPAEKQRVLAAAIQLGYVPNNSARALRSQNTSLVGVIIPTLDHAIYAKMVSGLQERLAQHGKSVIISTSDYDLEQERIQTRLLVGRGVESIVLVGLEHHPDTLEYLRRAGVAPVFTYTCELGLGAVAVGLDNRLAGATVAGFLLELGHKRFGMVAGVTRGNDRATQRRDGFLARLGEAGVPASDIVVLEAPYKIDGGAAAMRSLMQTHPRPTAIFCGSDILAVGAIKYCHVAGIAVPGEVSVVGFDNLEIAELVTPELTTLNVPAREMGEAAADALIRLGEKKETSIATELPTRLIVRDSTGPAGSASRK
ncbi:LacI family DNA-binding transcriptional regulator [Oricola indica]|uniref:LacI family DNA-binding transcriptional regulator n=1 Tax=Oricola indica TaxID=2872591 RepID=UPI001CC1B2E0|nr:LacI family DNA-binding transcriptional regulator [Oricola indica]